MQAILEATPQVGHITVNIRVDAPMNVSAYMARRKVGVFAMNEVSYLLRAGDPQLIIGARLAWRVPISLTLRSKGVVGEIGHIDVDVETGQMHVMPNQIEEMNQRAEAFALSAASATND